ncbi:unnamed protein product [Moneuplotes crassus]|uniref:PWWP domain-containing protein n=1 Tax=Euplotes crassus TaxID=5936 RepID=A0AAD1XRG4_EUPCR|nr:unnamed protein product [Moneuplotes crassus]
MSDQFKLNEVVWGKVRGYPYWPAQIISLPPGLSKSKKNSWDTRYSLRFFGDGKISKLGIAKMKKFAPNLDIYNYTRVKRRYRNDMREALIQAQKKHEKHNLSVTEKQPEMLNDKSDKNQECKSQEESEEHKNHPTEDQSDYQSSKAELHPEKGTKDFNASSQKKQDPKAGSFVVLPNKLILPLRLIPPRLIKLEQSSQKLEDPSPTNLNLQSPSKKRETKAAIKEELCTVPPIEASQAIFKMAHMLGDKVIKFK